MTVLLINPNGSAAATAAMLAIARRHLARVVGWTNPAGPPMITDAEGLARAGRQIAEADLPDADGLIVAAFGDPGAAALAARHRAPVVGIGAAAARAASRGGAAFAVATTTPDLRGPIDRLMAEAGAEGEFLGTFVTPGDPVALLGDPPALDAALLRACTAAEAAGARRIIIGGGPLASAADRLSDQVSADLVQPVPEACRALAALLR
ncbi:MAG: aspartate/glutamate racemase family protein [Pseudomonadota bacterium]